MPDNSFSEEIFPNIQSKPPLAQLAAVSSHPVTSYLGEQTDPHLATTSFQVVVESNEVSPEPPFFFYTSDYSVYDYNVVLLLTLQVLFKDTEKYNYSYSSEIISGFVHPH